MVRRLYACEKKSIALRYSCSFVRDSPGKFIFSFIFVNVTLEFGCNNLKHLKLKLITLNHVL
nr:MAG TPA: hypothetical protein [Caudoviricetes sp.]